MIACSDVPFEVVVLWTGEGCTPSSYSGFLSGGKTCLPSACCRRRVLSCGAMIACSDGVAFRGVLAAVGLVLEGCILQVWSPRTSPLGGGRVSYLEVKVRLVAACC